MCVCLFSCVLATYSDERVLNGGECDISGDYHWDYMMSVMIIILTTSMSRDVYHVGGVHHRGRLT